MAKKVDKTKNIPYVDRLDNTSRDRYFEKLKFVDNFNPYEQCEPKLWLKNEDSYPACTYPDIVNYLVLAVSFYTLEQMGSYKSLEAHNQFTSGWVRDIKVRIFGENRLVTCRVSHSQSLSEKPLQPWVVAEKDGKILTAHCDCMAGLGEACTHVGALLFAVEATVRIRETKTATAVKAYWLLPASKKGVQYAEISDINFTAAKTRKKKLDMQIHDLSSPKHIQPSPAHSFKRSDTPVPTAEEFSEFLGKLSECDSKPAILSLIEPFSDHYIPPALQPDFPPLLSELYKEECYAMEYNNLLEYCKEVEVSVSEHQIKVVEEATRAQSGSKLWFRFRAGRVTASRLKAVCKTKADSPSQSLIRSICYPEMTKFSSRATQWGCTHEKVAREQYIAVKRNEGHDNLEFGESGFVINKDLPFMGASPDGIVSCDCCGDGCFEIKCPYCVKDSKLSDIESKDFCLEISSDGTKKLKQTHNYYYQVQCQLFTCGKEYCDFVVWTKSDIHVETVEPDVDFWDQAAPTAAIFFERVLLPELTGKFFSRKKSVFSSCDNKILQKESDCNSAPTSEINESDSTVWCICKKPEEGKMIACHNENCKTEWFHFKCVGLKRAPNKSSVWYCPACKQQPKFSKKKMPPKIKV